MNINHSTSEFVFIFFAASCFVSPELLVSHRPAIPVTVAVSHYKALRTVKDYCQHLYPVVLLQQLYSLDSLPFSILTVSLFFYDFFVLEILIQDLVSQSTPSNNFFKVQTIGSIFLESILA